MKLTREQLYHIARFARIELTDEEVDELIPDLNSILEYIKQLDEIDTKDVPQIDQITGLKDIMEADKIKPFLDTEGLINASPQPIKNNMIEVKKTI